MYKNYTVFYVCEKGARHNNTELVTGPRSTTISDKSLSQNWERYFHKDWSVHSDCEIMIDLLRSWEHDRKKKKEDSNWHFSLFSTWSSKPSGLKPNLWSTLYADTQSPLRCVKHPPSTSTWPDLHLPNFLTIRRDDRQHGHRRANYIISGISLFRFHSLISQQNEIFRS